MLHSGGTSQSFFLGNLNKRAKVIVLQIKGLANQVGESSTAVVLYPEKSWNDKCWRFNWHIQFITFLSKICSRPFLGSLATAYLPVPFHFCPNYHPSLNYLLLWNSTPLSLQFFRLCLQTLSFMFPSTFPFWPSFLVPVPLFPVTLLSTILVIRIWDT